VLADADADFALLWWQDDILWPTWRGIYPRSTYAEIFGTGGRRFEKKTV